MYVHIIHLCFSFYGHSITFHLLFLAFPTVVHWVSFFACVMYEWTICFYEHFLFQVPWFALFHIVCNYYHCVFWECFKYKFVLTVFSPTSDPKRAPFLVRPFPFLSPFLTSFIHLLHKRYCNLHLIMLRIGSVKPLSLFL